MKTLLKVFLIGICILSTFIACKHRNDADAPTTLSVELDKTIHVSVSEEIDITDSTNSIGSISQVVIADTIALIRNSGNLIGVNLETGRVTSRYSRKGRANDEYLTIWSMGLDDGKVYIYDINSKKIMYFDISGRFLSQTPVAQTTSEKPFQDFIKRNDGSIVGKRVFGVGDMPELSIYDSNFRYTTDIQGFNLRSGTHFGYPFFQNYKGDIFYVRSMLNDIYIINNASAEKIYTIDFGKNNIPSLERFKDEIEIIDYANKSPEKYATFISNIYDSADYFCFMFIAKEQRMYAVYDKSSDKVFPFEFENGDKLLTQIISYDDEVYLFWESTAGNISITTLSIASLLAQNTEN